MEELTLAQFTEQADRFDRIVRDTPDIDRFCSASDWILPASASLMRQRLPWLFRGGSGYAALMRGQHARGWRYAEPLEAMWGLASPLVGPDPRAIAAEFAELCRARADEWDVLMLSGVPTGSALQAALGRGLSTHFEVGIGPRMTRNVASLDGGLDGYLSRRSRNTRRALRKAGKAAARAGVRFERGHAGDVDGVFARIMAVEARSWKGLDHVGIDRGGMRDFYRRMIARLAARDAARVVFAVDGERDVGYVFGGVLGDTYRGLQFSYDHGYHRLSLGNLLQLEQIAELCREGFAWYDLGMGMQYKERWAEHVRESLALLVVKKTH